MFFYLSNAHDIITFKALNMINDLSIKLQPFEAQAQLLKVLTHPARLAILNILRDGEHCVCHMEAHLGYRQAYISQQLAVLREAGLIQDRRDGWNIYYRVTDPRVFSVFDTIQLMTGQPAVPFDREGVVCPCPHCSSGNKKA
jgi:DNA-binding transcriptional ArsR family regulator